jgi:hypothetical protein
MGHEGCLASCTIQGGLAYGFVHSLLAHVNIVFIRFCLRWSGLRIGAKMWIMYWSMGSMVVPSPGRLMHVWQQYAVSSECDMMAGNTMGPSNHSLAILAFNSELCILRSPFSRTNSHPHMMHDFGRILGSSAAQPGIVVIIIIGVVFGRQ